MSVHGRSVVVIHGPNLNRLGRRQPEVYGTMTLAQLEEQIGHWAQQRDLEVEFFQSNSEAELIERVHRAADAAAAVIINPGAFTHTSIALRDALAEIADGAGYIEVHLSNVHAREEFRHHSFLADRARGVIAGLGVSGYLAAIEYFATNLR